MRQAHGHGDRIDGIADAALEERFRRQATRSYEELKGDVTRTLASLRRKGTVSAAQQATGPLRHFRKRLEELAGVDFFGAPARKEVETMLRALAGHDLKDEKFGQPAASGVQQLIKGLIQAHPDDQDRLTAGLGMFDHLLASFSGGPGRRKGTPSRARKRAKRAK